MVAFFRKRPATEIALEACGRSHHWARKLTELGHDVRLIPPQYLKPFVKRAKNHRNDAEAICEAAGRPGMRFVLTKSAEPQAQGMVLKVRETLVGQRTQLANTLRGHAAEFGVIAAKGMSPIASLLEAIEVETAIPLEARERLALLGQEIEHLDTRIKELETKLTAMHKVNAVSQLLATIAGIGPIIALTLATEVDPAAFESGRHLPAWIGLTPKEHSTGGKQRMGGISRAGHERLRQLLVTGATAVIKLATRGQQVGYGVAVEAAAAQTTRARRGGTGQQDGPYRVGETGQGSSQSQATGWNARRGDDDQRRGLQASGGCRCGLRLMVVC
jgi:transposase